MKQVEIEDKKIFDKYQTREIMNSEYRFTTVFAWAHKYHFKYIENKNVLYIFGNQNNGDLQCYFPLGQEIKKETIDYIAELFEKFKQPFNLRPLSKEMVEKVIPFLNIKVIIGSKLSYRDYIYDYSLLCEYSGHGYKKKRKAVNKFYSSYNYAYISINKINCKEALSALKRIVFQLQDAGDKDEWDAYTRILNNFEALKLKGGMILIDGRIEGIAVAEAYHEMGAEVVIIATSDKVMDVAKEIASDGKAPVHGVVADLSDRDQLKRAFNESVELLGGRLDILFNNAGINRNHTCSDFTEEDFDLIRKVNYDAVFLLSQLAGDPVLVVVVHKGVELAANGQKPPHIVGNLKEIVVVEPGVDALVQLVVGDGVEPGLVQPAAVLPVDDLPHEPEVLL